MLLQGAKIMDALEIIKLIPIISATLVVCEKLYALSRQAFLKNP
jgi:hypothetical protein